MLDRIIKTYNQFQININKVIYLLNNCNNRLAILINKDILNLVTITHKIQLLHKVVIASKTKFLNKITITNNNSLVNKITKIPKEEIQFIL